MLTTPGTIALFAIGGALVLSGMLLLIRELRHEKRCTASCTATVSEVRVLVAQDGLFSTSKGGDKRYQPTLLYEVDGQTYRSQSPASDKPFSVGQQLTILYDPKRPGDQGRLTRRAFANVVAAAGVVLMLAAMMA